MPHFRTRGAMAGAGESSDLSVLSARVHRALAADQEVLVELRRFDDEYADLERVVRDLPAKTSHEVMVPFTDVAFYPGRLVHTNELLVLLGADVYAERSATQTLDIIARRRALLADKIRGADASVDAMDSRLGALEAVAAADGDPSAAGALATRREGRATLTSKPDGTVDITEAYDDGEALEPLSRAREPSRVPESSAAEDAAPAADLDDFITRLAALEARDAETDDALVPSPTASSSADSDDDSDYERDDAAMAIAFARKNAEANVVASRGAAQARGAANAAQRHRAAIKAEVAERAPPGAGGAGGGDVEWKNDDASRPFSRFKRRAMGLESDPRNG